MDYILEISELMIIFLRVTMTVGPWRNGPIPRRHLRAYLENYPMGATYSRVLPACKTKTVTLKSGEGHPRVRTTIFLTFLRT